MNDFTRRSLLAGITAAATSAKALSGAQKSWRPKLGILGEYTPGNVAFAKAEGFTSMGLWSHRDSALSADTVTDATIEEVRSNFERTGLHLSVVGSTLNHISPDLDERAKVNAYFAKVIELAGKLNAPFVGTASGTMPHKPLKTQVDEVVRVYEEKYFPVCQKYKVRILWEPWPDGPNIATGAQGYEALFTAFGNSPYVGLQYDPSHLVRLFMDTLQTARDYADKIYDVHLKDTEIRWPILHKVGIRPFDNANWWRYRIPGNGSIDWPAFFTILEDRGYTGAMNIEHEDDLYGAMPPTHEFTEDYKNGFRLGMRYLRTYVPV